MSGDPVGWVGVDGCRGGWLACRTLPELQVEVLPDIESVWRFAEGASGILLDMPIGLLEGPGHRACDEAARRRLGWPRAASVFTPPVRQVLGLASHREVSAASRRLTGQGLSIQAFHLIPRIGEVDDFLRGDPRRARRLRESHPELAFQVLAGGQAMAHGKRSAPGQGERLEVLAAHHPSVLALIARARPGLRARGAALDDLLDALALAVAAWTAGGRLEGLPARSEWDPRGLPMQLAVPVM